MTGPLRIWAAGAALASLATGCGAQATGAASGPIGRPITAISTLSATHKAQGPSRLPSPPLAKSEPVIAPDDLGAARRTARQFFAAYVRFLYDRARAPKGPNVSRQLQSQFRDQTARITPAERATRPRILHVTVAAAGPPMSATATATVLSGGSRSRLTATLEPHDGRWIVTAVES